MKADHVRTGVFGKKLAFICTGKFCDQEKRKKWSDEAIIILLHTADKYEIAELNVGSRQADENLTAVGITRIF